jgi:hypothetical protein
MRALLLALVVVGFAGAAGAADAQSKSAPAGMMGTAGVKTHLEALHYKDVHDLRRGPDGQWVGNATQGNVPKMVTIAPDGTVTAR